MIKQIRQFFVRLLAGANTAIIIIMLVVGYSGHIDPTTHPVWSSIGLSFPLLLAANVLFIVVWMLVKPRWVLLPLAGLLAGYQPVRNYFPLNPRQNPPLGSIKVMSYNVWGFGWTNEYGQVEEIARYIAEQQADIVCLQEAEVDPPGQKIVDSLLNPIYQYCDTAKANSGADVLTVYSKYPIIGKEHIEYNSAGNNSAAFFVKTEHDTIIVINNHLETIGLTMEEKSNFKQMVDGGMRRDSAETTSQTIIEKIAEAARKRAPQAEAVAEYIAQNKDRSIILCGDFNDSPISYTHHTIARQLTDCYVEAGFGPGISYHDSNFYVRIDNIMCSKNWKPYRCKVDNSITVSDHYPISCYLKNKRN